MVEQKENYFNKLFNFNKLFLNQLRIRKKPYTIYEIKNSFNEKSSKLYSTFLVKLPKKTKTKKINVKSNIGLNSIGLLSDRLTILSAKYNALKIRQNNFKEAKKLKNIEIRDTIHCLAKAKKSNAFNFKKLTGKKNNNSISTNWNESYLKLLITNLTLWEAQEILYLKDLNKVNAKELRNYISLFSKLNINRNILITECENYYWNE